MRAPAGPWEVVCATAHRTMPAGSHMWVRDNLRSAAEWLRDKAGTRYAITGLARGGDLDWADAALQAGLQVWGFRPFDGHDKPWTKTDQRRLRHLTDQIGAVRLRTTGVLDPDLPDDARKRAATRLLHHRDDAMLDAAGAVIAVWDPARRTGGTHATLIKAVRRGHLGVHLDPTGRTVSFQLPTIRQLTGPGAAALCRNALAANVRGSSAGRWERGL